MNYDKVEDTFFEAFKGRYVRAIITGPNKEIVKQAAYDSTSTPGAVIGRVEGGVEGFLDKNQTPDGRDGAIVQYWFGSDDLEKFELELSYRIRQDILVKPFTRVFNYNDNPEGFIGMEKQVGNCGDGYEWKVNEFNKTMIDVPIAVPDFQIEEKLAYSEGIMGANFWYMCDSEEAVLNAGKIAIEEILTVEGTCAPFGICSAASKPETNYPWIGPSTNHYYCPSLKDKLGNISKVPEGIKYIPEIVINAIDEDSMKKAVKSSIDAICDIDGVKIISAGNFEGKLGDKTYKLLDILR
ncbi:formylmethanofuran--tetrahydromethanopterin N-formyltransferase [Methanobrevibacter sp. DSM 116169]|uniref:formylmethanofuran--tetrahydromethanopterin N-formyltransferase n=1 Tax=Methanobrevibacter sp. DSM 116169 TaxID=3242727 RepID=UPI0038FC1F2E